MPDPKQPISSSEEAVTQPIPRVATDAQQGAQDQVVQPPPAAQVPGVPPTHQHLTAPPESGVAPQPATHGYPPATGGAAPPPPPAVTPPPMPAGGGRHGAGYWVAVIAGGAALAMLLLIGGFFIGRSTRDSPAEVQRMIQAQKQADQLAQTKQLQELADKLRSERASAVRRAADRARARGIREGRIEGRQTGYEEGRAQGQAEGESSGFAQGQASGYSSGFDDALCLADAALC